MSTLSPSIPSFEDIASTMELLPDADERFRFLIDLGRKLPGLPDELKNDDTFVRGCQSSVWIVCDRTEGAGPPRLELQGESDALIVSGLVAIMKSLYSGKTAEEIIALDPQSELARMDLEHHLSPGRRNGLAQMIGRIRACAAEALA